jgi:hypothetical protein
MTDRKEPFASSLFPFVASNLAPHRNPVTCILAGLDRPLAVCTQAERIEGDIVVIRPGVEHWRGNFEASATEGRGRPTTLCSVAADNEFCVT